MEIEIIELNMPYGGYIIRGHNHSKQDIVDAINKAEEKPRKTYSKPYNKCDALNIKECVGESKCPILRR